MVCSSSHHTIQMYYIPHTMIYSTDADGTWRFPQRYKREDLECSILPVLGPNNSDPFLEYVPDVFRRRGMSTSSYKIFSVPYCLYRIPCKAKPLEWLELVGSFRSALISLKTDACTSSHEGELIKRYFVSRVFDPQHFHEK